MAEEVKFPDIKTFGREVLYSSYDYVDERNIIEVLESVKPLYLKNQSEIIFLQNYRRGIQPVLGRTKKVRPDICNKVVKNRANEIVTFKTGYLLGEPIQYIARDSDNKIAEELKALNDNMYISKKSNLDKRLAENMYVCGTSYRMVLANPKYEKGSKLSPFNIYVPNPAFNGIVYHTGLGNKPLLCFTDIVFRDTIEDKDKHKFCCYTDNTYFEVVDNAIVKIQSHTYGRIPMVEYPANSCRMGAFEPVISILNAINLVTSNRIDGVEQFIQSLMKFINVDIDEEGLELLSELGAIKLIGKGGNGDKQDVEFMTAELNQTQIQTLVDSLDQDVLILCGMPNRNGGSSTSDTGSAVIMRDGWSDAEARAKEDELMFKDSELDFLDIVLNIIQTLNGGDLSLSDIDIRFTRKNYENITQKSTVLTTMLGCNKIHPRLAFSHCGLFADPEVAYAMSKEYYDEVSKPVVTEVPNNPKVDEEKPKSTEEADNEENTGT